MELEDIDLEHNDKKCETLTLRYNHIHDSGHII